MCHMSARGFFYNFFKKIKKNAMCQSYIVPRGKHSVMWQWQYHVCTTNGKDLIATNFPK